MAEIVDVVDELTTFVVTGKLAWVAFELTVTVAGTVAATVLLLDKLTTAPPGGAAPLRVTVPLEAFPPTTEGGLSVSEEMSAGATVSIAVRLEPP